VNLWAFGIYFAAVILLVAGMLLASWVLGQRQDRAGEIPYEGGIVPEGSARARLSVRFYLVAMFFVIFDLEAVFIYAWAVAARELGWLGYWEILIFIGILAATLGYLWRAGALDWGKVSRHTR
jgi:NADH-quinone oxidoreductase subunit A